MVKVILTKQVPKVGKSGEVVDVSDGYATNLLFPKKLAILATAKNLDLLKRKVQSDHDLKALQHGLLENAISVLPNMTLEIKAKANEKGHLFSKISSTDIVEALLQHRISISKDNVVLKDSIKNLGNYDVLIKEGEYQVKIVVSIIKD